MKKFTFLWAFLPLFFATSCIGGDDIYESAPKTFSKVYTIDADHMNKRIEIVEGEKIVFYEWEESVSALTYDVFDKGVLQAFYLSGNDKIIPLPYSDFRKDGDYQWEEYLTAEFQPYKIKFIIKTSDYADFAEYPTLVRYYDILVRFLW